ASISDDETIRLWDPSTGQHAHTLTGHTGWVRSVAYSPDGTQLASTSDDETIRLWDPTTGREQRRFEGHTGSVTGLAWSPDGEWLASTSDDGTARLWPLAKDAGNAYSNAKVALVGDSGVGKTGLGLVLSKQKWRATESTHGRHIWPLTVDKADRVAREVLLWDLAGQPSHRIVHQISLTDLAVALVVFDAHSDTNPLGGVDHWLRALRVAQSLDSNADLRTYLVAARVDVSGTAMSEERIQRFVDENRLDGYLPTSAKEGTGVAKLRARMLDAIDWDQPPVVSSNKLFQDIRHFLVKEKARSGGLISSGQDLQRAFEHRHRRYGRADITHEFATSIGLLEGRGLIRRLSFGDQVLLQPEVLDGYAASLVNAARIEPDGLASIPEEDARAGKFVIPKDVKIAEAKIEQLVLISMIEDLLRHEIALREGADLVFPSQLTRTNDELPEPKGKALELGFDGPVSNIYATLIVRLGHSGVFSLSPDDLWQHAAVYSADASGR
ncbi:MAG: hypothetical protein GY773_03140, partial [Actinomycetia bacterium]|nr:hypothetical protein [Actinomycetes bacterium]